MSPQGASPPLAVGQRWEYAYQGRFDELEFTTWEIVELDAYDLTAKPVGKRSHLYYGFTMTRARFEGDAHMWRIAGSGVSSETPDIAPKVVVRFLRRKDAGDA